MPNAGIGSQTVLVTDDVASAPRGREHERRGVAGCIAVLKAAGARADEGASLLEVAAAARLANERTRSVGVGLAPCMLPTAAEPTFEIADGEIDIGMGLHGEAGVSRTALMAADDVADTLLARSSKTGRPRPASRYSCS